MSKPLYKTTIVIWSEENTSDQDLESIARRAISGDSYCSKQECKAVNDPSSDPDWDDTEFFDEPEYLDDPCG